jgi:hypothetical protein
MKVSVFKIGLIMVIIGMIWISVIFNETEKNHDSVVLQKSNSIESKLEFSGIGIGYYKIKVSNISENSVNLQIEFGDTHSQKMVAPGIMVVMGSLIMMLISYLKIKNYNIEQPDENIS